jgi:hypothetical protein
MKVFRNHNVIKEVNMRNLKAVLGIAAMLFLSGVAAAQTDDVSHDVIMNVHAIAVIDVTTASVTLEVTAPLLGGDDPQDDTDASTYLQYTSTVASGLTRSITAAWDTGDTAPAGCLLKLVATTQGGKKGSPEAQITMSDVAQPIITGIGSCATGRGTSSGANLTYTLEVDDVESLIAGESKTATVTFTLTDDGA